MLGGVYARDDEIRDGVRPFTNFIIYILCIRFVLATKTMELMYAGSFTSLVLAFFGRMGGAFKTGTTEKLDSTAPLYLSTFIV